MTSTPTLARRPHVAHRPARVRRGALALPAVGLVLVVAGCAGGAAQPAATDDATAAADAPVRRAEDRGRVVGQIATVGDALLQLRGTDEQTAVTWTDATTITQTVAATLADVTVGACVVAVAEPSTSTSTDADASGDAPVEATSVTVSPAQDDGTCATAGPPGGPGGGVPGALPDGVPTDLPSGFPTDGPAADGARPDGAPTGAPDGGPQVRAFGAGVGGQVAAVSGSTLTVQVTAADGTTSDRQVVVSDATTYQRTAAADASALVVGRCATVRGEADDSGEVAATAIQVTDPTDGGCTSGFAMRGGPGGAPGPDDATDEEGTDA